MKFSLEIHWNPLKWICYCRYQLKWPNLVSLFHIKTMSNKVNFCNIHAEKCVQHEKKNLSDPQICGGFWLTMERKTLDCLIREELNKKRKSIICTCTARFIPTPTHPTTESFTVIRLNKIWIWPIFNILVPTKSLFVSLIWYRMCVAGGWQQNEESFHMDDERLWKSFSPFSYRRKTFC